MEGRIPEADPTRAQLETVIDPARLLKDNDVNMDQLYDDLIKGFKETRPVDTDNDDIDWDVLSRYLINET